MDKQQYPTELAAVEKPQIAYINLGPGVSCALHWLGSTGHIVKIVVPAVTFHSEGGIEHMKTTIAMQMGIPQVGIPVEVEHPTVPIDHMPRLAFPFRDVQAFQRKFPSCLPDNKRYPHLPSKEYMDARVKFYQEELDELYAAEAECTKARDEFEAFMGSSPNDWDDPSAKYQELVKDYVKWLVKLADAHFDLCWILMGTMDGMGVPFVSFWNEGFRANMDKEYSQSEDGADGTHKFGITKPEGWVGPEPTMEKLFMALIKNGGFTEIEKTSTGLTIVESDTGFTTMETKQEDNE